MDGLPLIGNFSAGALLALVVLMILTDRLVTRKRLEEARSDRDKALAANDKLLAALATTTRQSEELLEHARTTNSLLSALTQTHAREGPVP